MDDATASLRAGAPHLNNGLFADYYLNEIVPHLPDLNEVLFGKARDTLAALRDLWAKLDPAALDEAQLEELWIKPVLAALGHHFSVQVKIRYRERGFRKPDYVLVATADEARALTNAIYEPREITHALALADAKRWGVNLDQSAAEQRNPAQQIDEYLRYSELPWGILTDGRYWRLYQRDTSKYNSYYAVDLVDLLEHGRVGDFLYFYAFFRRQAFTDGWLAKVLAGSVEFAQSLSDTLENEVYDALEMIAQGFLDYRRNRLTAGPVTMRMIYEQSLVLLYRLLFIFFAESREILPVPRNREYTETRSLRAIKVEAARLVGLQQRLLHADSSMLYARLRDLFFAVDAGDPDFDLPAYNGRLFSDVEHPFLGANVVGDAQLAPALDRLARVDAPNGARRRVYVDYRDLDVRHLGSIYEKLLEYELDIAAEPLTLKGDKYAPAAPGDQVVKQPGQVYLRTGNNERKITGSYYTPDYIVRFIVEKTLEPLLTEITQRYADLDDAGQWQVRDAGGLTRAILDLNVLDPATGSGHFAVDATAYMAEWLRALALRPADIGEEDELLYWKRQIASACIYAVDLNPLAVELAKLSLWLSTLARGKPLSFLDHHIRVGNSLVGASLADIHADLDGGQPRRRAERQAQTAESGQLSLYDDAQFADSIGSAVGEMAQIEATMAEAVGDVKRQEAAYDAIRRRLSAWEQAADVWTARDFGLALTADEWAAVRALATTGATSPQVEQIVTQAEALAGRKDLRFLHWELAFPEVFFDATGKRKETPGFDAVIGNPPYVRQERIQPIKPYLQQRYAVYSGTADLFLYFYERGLKLLKPDHRLGYITSGTYMNSNSAKPFRQFIHDHAGLEWVANFGENQPFRGAEMVYPTIAVMRRGQPRETFRSLFVEGVVPYPVLGNTLKDRDWADSLADVTAMEEWRFQPAEITQLFGKLYNGHKQLQEIVGDNYYRGITTGLNEAFIVDALTGQKLVESDARSAEILKPMRRGQDLRPWYQIDSGKYLVWSFQGVQIDEFPAVRSHLERFHAGLARRWEPAHNECEWYELRPCSYYDQFSKPKIVWPDISKLPRFSWNETGDYLNNTGFFISGATSPLLGLLQSRSIWFIISQIATPLRLRAGLWQYRVLPQNVERLPIPDLTAQQDGNLAAIAEEITGLARRRYALHESTRHRIRADLGRGGDLNNALAEWWSLPDGSALRAQVKSAFHADIPLRERDEWEGFLTAQQAEHRRLTDAIVALETRLNAIVYDAFALTPDERDLIERTTKYPYGAV